MKEFINWVKSADSSFVSAMIAILVFGLCSALILGFVVLILLDLWYVAPTICIVSGLFGLVTAYMVGE